LNGTGAGVMERFSVVGVSPSIDFSQRVEGLLRYGEVHTRTVRPKSNGIRAASEAPQRTNSQKSYPLSPSIIDKGFATRTSGHRSHLRQSHLQKFRPPM
jgi:hypothetical protein